jgi:hypothetical protein
MCQGADAPRLGPNACGLPRSLAGAAPNPLGMSGNVDISRLSEEETKYLGGDMRFTHLVKGLDFALLNKASKPSD